MDLSNDNLTKNGADTVCVVLAVYKPLVGYLQQQLASLAAQTCPLSLCAVIADGQSADLVRDICAQLGIGLLLVEPDETPMLAAKAFEVGLTTALNELPDETAFFAFCDQDDIWHPERLSAGLAHARATGAALVHCDARIVDAEGTVLEPSLHTAEGRDPTPNLRQLVMRNTVSGMSALFTRRVAELSVPFPFIRRIYHDNWMAVIAASQPGGVAFVNRALVDYRQHGGNLVGAVPGSAHPLPARFSASWFRKGRTRYYRGQFVTLLLLTRLHERHVLNAGSFKELEAFRSFRFSWAVFLSDYVHFRTRGYDASADMTIQCFLSGMYRTLKGMIKGRIVGFPSAVRTEDIQHIQSISGFLAGDAKRLVEEASLIR